ncbi:MAG: D-Ala-D-Ala carboxypeptidase family metallohydrolase [Candidatus Sericytochromatia bacterium]|nr:D-Ala-D-Ala carboxypeptidase family metallohydrolase [Candidatus Sericytochromatia bacterium]
MPPRLTMPLTSYHLALAAVLVPLTAAPVGATLAGGREPGPGAASPALAPALPRTLAVPSAPPAASPHRLALAHVLDRVDAVPVLPGGRLLLEPVAPPGVRTSVTWRASQGELTYGTTTAAWTAPRAPGAYALVGTGLVDGRPVSRRLTCLVTVPVSRVAGGRLNGYPIGTYPRGFGAAALRTVSRGSRGDRYEVPGGFVELDHTNLALPVSAHYQLGEFQGKDAFVGGRKYMFFEPRLVEKLELLHEGLQAAGYRCAKLRIMSGYRSPWLNRAIGNRTTLSRHTYGDAADLIVQDHDGNGHVTRRDAEILLAAASRLDRDTDLTGGGAIYPPTGSHGWFVHTDTRGQVVRW